MCVCVYIYIYMCVCVLSEKAICAPPRLSADSPTMPLKQFQCSSDGDDGPLSSFQGRLSNASSFHASLLQAIGGVMSLALFAYVVSQAAQHFRSSEKQATCEGSFASQSICWVISLHSGMSRTVDPQEFLKVDVDFNDQTRKVHILTDASPMTTLRA